MSRVALAGLTALLVAVLPGTVSAQAEREAGPSTGRRHFLEQAERDRLQRQRWEAEEEEFRRRARARQRQREDYIQQHRQGDLRPAPDPPAVP